MRNHDEYNVMIQLFIDDELTGQEREALFAHLKDCASCQEQLEEAKAFFEVVKQARPRDEAPAALRERVLSHIGNPINRVAQQAPPAPITHMKSASRSYWTPLAAAAIFCIAVSGVLFTSYFRREFRARSFVEAAVANHREFGGGRLLDVQSSSPEVVAAWFAQRVSFPFRMPNAGIAADDRAKYTLAGGRLVQFGGEPAALVEFQMPNNRISLLVSSNKLANAAGGKVTHSDGLSFHARDLNELHVATWDNKGLTYALISSVAMGTISSCSTCHKDSSAVTLRLKRSRGINEHVQQRAAKRSLTELAALSSVPLR